jgi:uncharacterized protein YndB with AHSA1/START domain
MAERSSAPTSKEEALIIERIFDASRELVWKAWTDPEQAMRWWGPKGFTSPACEIDLRVGGKYLWCMRSPQGYDFWTTGVYKEIVPFERVVCTQSLADEKGNVVPASHYGMSADLPAETIVTVTFEEIAGRTRLVLRQEGAGDMLKGAERGWNQAFDKLAASLQAA